MWGVKLTSFEYSGFGGIYIAWGEELSKDVWEWGPQLETGFSVEQNLTAGWFLRF